MAENEVELPTAEAIDELPRWAVVAFAAWCARRVEPLFLAFTPKLPTNSFNEAKELVIIRKGQLWSLFT